MTRDQIAFRAGLEAALDEITLVRNPANDWTGYHRWTVEFIRSKLLDKIRAFEAECQHTTHLDYPKHWPQWIINTLEKETTPTKEPNHV